MNIGESYFRWQEELEESGFNLSREREVEVMDDQYRRTHGDTSGREDPLRPPQMSLSAFVETGQVDSTVPVLMQRFYTGKMVIMSGLANIPCIDLGVDGVLKELNTILGTWYATDSAVISVLNSCIAKGLDFGTTYAYLRPYWNDMSTIKHKLRILEREDEEMRRNVLTDGRITTRHVPARRVWDLCANRVVPYWVARKTPLGISHAWVDEKDRVNVMTPINGYEWPVPMPKDASLDLIRIEMLNARSRYSPHMAEYAWLDILCLRQEGGKSEHLRRDEWRQDVPTIGSVYEEAERVVGYFNGLGRPLNLTTDYFESDRCWFRRAWTLQEISDDLIIGGEIGNSILEEEVRRRFDGQLTSLRNIIRYGTSLDLVSEMQHRVSTKPLDKVAGLVYLLKTDSIPIYDTEQSAANAWEVLMDVMRPEFQAQLLFLYPAPGGGRKCWRPSWKQVMANKTIVRYFGSRKGRVRRTKDAATDYYKGCLIESGNVRGLSTELECPQGELVLSDATGAPRTLNVVADHVYPIPDGLYTLICYGRSYFRSDLWVIGQLRDDGKFEKWSVFRSADYKQTKLGELGLEEVKIFLC